MNFLAIGVSVLVGATIGSLITAIAFRRKANRVTISGLLRRHFHPTELTRLSTKQSSHPYRVAPDAYAGLSDWLASISGSVQGIGVPVTNSFMTTIGIASLAAPTDPSEAFRPSAIEFESIGVADQQQRSVPRHALWLFRAEASPVAVLWTTTVDHGRCGFVTRLMVEIACLDGPLAERLSADLFATLNASIKDAPTFRGKVLSLEPDEDATKLGVTFHKLRDVAREEVILPDVAIRLLERNVVRFVQQRPALRKAGMATKKGLLFYGPPGTGKTHTIHYLLGALKGHTTLLVTAEQIGALDQYAQLARLLQPSILVIEDVDLIARDRATSGVGEQSLLNRLLNEMDGLREDADVLFFLTTNRPEELESALASRPGRIDQAIEFPLPDASGRQSLLRLYSGEAELTSDVRDDLVRRTDGVSASFIKELMRRAVQFHLECNPEAETIRLSQNDVDQALDELLFAGGSLNRRLLGGIED